MLLVEEFVNQKNLQSLSKKKTAESSESGRDLHKSSTNSAVLLRRAYFVRRQNTNRAQKHEKNCIASKSLEQMTR